MTTKRKLIISWILGMLGFILSMFSFHVYYPQTTITLHWSFLFPLLASLAYGPKYALVAGIAGLGAFFPFLLWSTNGWPNVLTALLYSVWFMWQGYSMEETRRRPRFWNRPIIMYLYFALMAYAINRVFFPLLITFNPPPWSPQAIRELSADVVNYIAIKAMISQGVVLLVAIWLLEIPFVKRTLGLPSHDFERNNGIIALLACLISVGAWYGFIVLNRIFIDQSFSFVTLNMQNPYEFMALFAFLFAGVCVSILMMRGNTRRMEAEYLAKDKDQLVTSISQNIEQGMIYRVCFTPPSTRQFTYVSPSVIKLYGITPEEVYKDSMKIYAAVHPDDLNDLIQKEQVAIENLNSLNAQVRIINHKGIVRWSSLVSRPVKLPDGSIMWDGIEFDITEQVNAQNQLAQEKEKLHHLMGIAVNRQADLEDLSYKDALTGLYNRRYYEMYSEEFDMSNRVPLALIMADVNSLKLVNDALGHNDGDELLKIVADSIHQACRQDDIAARVGGDEFVLLMPDIDQSKAEGIVTRLREILSSKTVKSIPVSVSFGVAVKTSPTENLNDIYKLAEKQMYKVKLETSQEQNEVIIRRLLGLLYSEYKDEKHHAAEVALYCEKLARALHASEKLIEEVVLCATYHDIGKIAIPPWLLEKVGKLSDEEMTQIQRHSVVGYQILKTHVHYSSFSEIVLAHHERFDGTGYPRGLKEEEIPLGARILMIADAYVAMRSLRPNRNILSLEDAALELKRCSGTQFDPGLVATFLKDVLILKE